MKNKHSILLAILLYFNICSLGQNLDNITNQVIQYEIIPAEVKRGHEKLGLGIITKYKVHVLDKNLRLDKDGNTIEILLKLLKSETHDFSALVMLYALSGEGGRFLSLFAKNWKNRKKDIELWRNKAKKEDIIYWQEWGEKYFKND